MADEIMALRAEIRRLDAELSAWKRASAALLSHLRPLLPPAAEAALAEELAAMVEEEENELQPGDPMPVFIAVNYLHPDKG